MLLTNHQEWKMLKWGSKTNSQRSHIRTIAAVTGGEVKMLDDEMWMGKLSPTQPSCARSGLQRHPPLPWVPSATMTTCSLLRCKRSSPRRLERAPSGPPCEICACLHYYYFILETTNYFIFPDLHTNIKDEAIQTPYNLIILHYSAGDHF